LPLSGQPYVVLDNIRGQFGGGTLEKCLDRFAVVRIGLLGVNKEVDLPLCLVWFGTGNNLILTGDMVRRTLHIRLESPLERPDLRKDF